MREKLPDLAGKARQIRKDIKVSDPGRRLVLMRLLISVYARILARIPAKKVPPDS
jgi:hypothetical protein